MFMKRDFRFGLPYYKYVGDTEVNDFKSIFSWEEIGNIFSGIYASRSYLNQNGEQVITYYNVGFGKNEVITDFMTEFENCQWMTPFYCGDSEKSAEGNAAALNKLKMLVKTVLDENAYKYIKMTETLGFVYDPIKSYFETGSKNDTTTYAGNEAMGRVYNALGKITGMEVSGPLDSYTFQNDTATLQIDVDRKVDVNLAAAESNEKGMKATGLNQFNPALTDGTENKITDYTTTYDDDEDGRKAAYRTDEGTTAVANWQNSQEDLPAYGKVSVGGPGAVDYTDTKSFTGRTDTTGGTWSKNGSTVPAQELIDTQRQIAKFSVEKEFFNDLKKKMLIAGWD